MCNHLGNASTDSFTAIVTPHDYLTAVQIPVHPDPLTGVLGRLDSLIVGGSPLATFVASAGFVGLSGMVMRGFLARMLNVLVRRALDWLCRYLTLDAKTPFGEFDIPSSIGCWLFHLLLDV